MIPPDSPKPTFVEIVEEFDWKIVVLIVAFMAMMVALAFAPASCSVRVEDTPTTTVPA